MVSAGKGTARQIASHLADQNLERCWRPDGRCARSKSAESGAARSRTDGHHVRSILALVHILSYSASSAQSGRGMEHRGQFRELPIEPHGVLWQDDFVDSEHEQRLISIFLDELKWPDRSGRLSLHYGHTFDYKTFGVDPGIPYKEFPEWLQPLIPTTEARPPDQVCLQYYPPGAGIPPHVDAHGPYDQLYALSLGTPAIMQFRKGEQRVDLDLKPRSMMQMTGDARLHWTHGIKKRKNDTLPGATLRQRGNRWSITYRWVREGGECECGNLELCDTAQRRNGVEKEKRSVKELAARIGDDHAT